MSVRSEVLKDGERVSRKPSAIVDRSAIERTRTPVERASAIGIWAVGWLGTIAAFHGGWVPLLKSPAWGAVALATLAQLALTYTQVAYKRVPLVSWPSRALDAALTAAGFAPFWIGPLAGLLAGLGLEGGVMVRETALPWSLAAAWALSWVAALLPAWYPENRLIR